MRRLARSRRGLAWALPLAAIGACRGSESAPAPGAAVAPLAVARLLSEDPAQAGVAGDAGFEHALAPRRFTFPDDDGPHPAFRSEWWYFTGVVRTPGTAAAPRRFGFEMTIFRRALGPARAPSPSAWATRDVYMAHFAITDADGAGPGAHFHAYEQFARDGLALAGARAHPFAAWVDDWRMEGPVDAAGTLPVHLRARGDTGAAIDLLVGTEDPKAPAATGKTRGPIAHGDGGLSAKGPRPGQASYYYSRTRLPTRGRLTLPAVPGRAAEPAFEVAGQSWMDREWATGALGAGVRGWDWLGAHLSDGRDLMLYRLRDAGGQTTSESRLTIIDPQGTTRQLGAAQFTVTPIQRWTSPQTGTEYPVGVRIQAPEVGLTIEVRPWLVEQELRLSVGYWEGAVALTGSGPGGAIGGEGYLELTGYGGRQRQ